MNSFTFALFAACLAAPQPGTTQAPSYGIEPAYVKPAATTSCSETPVPTAKAAPVVAPAYTESKPAVAPAAPAAYAETKPVATETPMPTGGVYGASAPVATNPVYSGAESYSFAALAALALVL